MGISDGDLVRRERGSARLRLSYPRSAWGWRPKRWRSTTRPPPAPFSSNGYDDTFAIAVSREHAPVIDYSAAAAASPLTTSA